MNHPRSVVAFPQRKTSNTEPTFTPRDSHAAVRESGLKYRYASSSAGARTMAPMTRSSMPIVAIPRVSRSGGPAFAKAMMEYPTELSTLNAKTPFAIQAFSSRNVHGVEAPRHQRRDNSHSFVAS